MIVAETWRWWNHREGRQYQIKPELTIKEKSTLWPKNRFQVLCMKSRSRRYQRTAYNSYHRWKTVWSWFLGWKQVLMRSQKFLHRNHTFLMTHRRGKTRSRRIIKHWCLRNIKYPTLIIEKTDYTTNKGIPNTTFKIEHEGRRWCNYNSRYIQDRWKWRESNCRM